MKATTMDYNEHDGDADNSDNDDEIPIITVESSEPCFPDYSSHPREITHTREMKHARQHEPNNAFLWRQQRRADTYQNSHHDSYKYESRHGASVGNHKRNSSRSKRFINRAPKYADRWTKLQTDVLVKNWRENFNVIKTSKAKSVWVEIAKRVNEVDKGQVRTVPQCKDKIRNLIAKYKRVKGSNKLADDSSELLEYFDDLDSVLVNVHMATLTGDKNGDLEAGYNHHEMNTASNEERMIELDAALGNQELIRVPIPELPTDIRATHCENIIVVEPSTANIDAVTNDNHHSVASLTEKNNTSFIRKDDDVTIKAEEKICEIGRVMSSQELIMVKQPLKNIDAFNHVIQNPADVATRQENKLCGATSSSLLGSSSMSESDGENYTSIIPQQKTSQTEASRTNMSKARLKRNRKSKFEDLLDVQRSLIQAFERSNERHYAFLKNMIEEQRQIDASERQKDRDFFLALAKTFAKQ